MSSCSNKGGKRIKAVLNFRVIIVFFGSMRINAETLLEILEIELGATSLEPKTKSSH